MIRKVAIIFVFIISCQSFVNGQQIITPSKGIEVKLGSDLTIASLHLVEAKQTLYGISRAYGLPVAYLAKINKIDQASSLGIGSELIIPIRRDLIKVTRESAESIPVYYIVQPKETIFRISRIYFDKQIEDITRLNNLNELKLDIGQRVQIGWLHISGTETMQQTADDQKTEEEFDDEFAIDSSTVSKTDPQINNEVTLVQIDTTLTNVDSTTIEEELKPDYKSFYTKGIALWNKNSSSTDLYVLHNDAQLQTEIELYNPVNNRRVFAIVVGKIPKNTYSGNFDVLLSPGVAKQLGARDSRFQVEIKYFK